MHKKNCWEYMNCGRQRGGVNVSELGECPVSGCFSGHGLNDGINGGRACWAITGTFCGGKTQGSFVNKLKSCANCDFAHYVQDEERKSMISTPDILARVKEGAEILSSMKSLK